MNKEVHLGNGSWNVGNIIIKCSFSFAHKNMVEVTQKGNHMLINTLDKMHDSNMIMEETKFKIQRKNVKCTKLTLKNSWNS